MRKLLFLSVIIISLITGGTTLLSASISLDKSATGTTVVLDYAYDNSGEAESVVTNSATGNTGVGTSPLPADPFDDFVVALSSTTEISYSGSFAESEANDGSVTGAIVMGLTDDTYVAPITLGAHLTVSNIPTGLNAVVTRNSANQVTLTLSGNATTHTDSEDVSNLNIT